MNPTVFVALHALLIIAALAFWPAVIYAGWRIWQANKRRPDRHG